MRFKVIFNTTGIILKFISLIFILPVIFAFIYKDISSICYFVLAGVVSLIFGFLFCLNDASEKDIDNITRAEAFATVIFGWVMFGLVCTIPFLFYGLNFIDSLFEAFSGVSTTGATILSDFSLYPETFFSLPLHYPVVRGHGNNSFIYCRSSEVCGCGQTDVFC